MTLYGELIPRALLLQTLMCVNNFVFSIFAAGLLSRSSHPVPLKYLVEESIKGDVRYCSLRGLQGITRSGAFVALPVLSVPIGLCHEIDWCLHLYTSVHLSMTCTDTYTSLHLLKWLVTELLNLLHYWLLLCGTFTNGIFNWHVCVWVNFQGQHRCGLSMFIIVTDQHTEEIKETSKWNKKKKHSWRIDLHTVVPLNTTASSSSRNNQFGCLVFYIQNKCCQKGQILRQNLNLFHTQKREDNLRMH